MSSWEPQHATIILMHNAATQYSDAAFHTTRDYLCWDRLLISFSKCRFLVYMTYANGSVKIVRERIVYILHGICLLRTSTVGFICVEM